MSWEYQSNDYTTEILNEYQKILKRDFGFNEEEIEEIIEKILTFATRVEPREKVKAVEDDPDDNAIIECALESKSKYIITYDTHLLKIKEYKGIIIIKPEIARAIFWELIPTKNSYFYKSTLFL